MLKYLPLSLLADDMIIHVNDAKDSTRKCLQLVNNFAKIDGHKLAHKNQYTSSMQNDKRPRKEFGKQRFS